MYCWPSARAARSVHWSYGASKLRLVLRRMKLVPLPLRTLSCAAAEAAAAHVVRRRDERRRDLRVARQRRGAEVGPVERHAVLVGREAEHGEAGGVALGAEDRRDAGDRRRHRVEIALLIGADRGAARRLLGAADVRRAVVPVHAIALGDGAHRVEDDHAGQLHVGDEDLLVGRASHLEPPRRVAERGDGDEIVAVAAGKGDREPAVPIGAHGAVHTAPHGRRGDVGALDRIVVVARHLAADDVELLGGGGSWDDEQQREERGHEENEASGDHGCVW